MFVRGKQTPKANISWDSKEGIKVELSSFINALVDNITQNSHAEEASFDHVSSLLLFSTLITIDSLSAD
jgi:hypothetical protein